MYEAKICTQKYHIHTQIHMCNKYIQVHRKIVIFTAKIIHLCDTIWIKVIPSYTLKLIFCSNKCKLCFTRKPIYKIIINFNE